MRYYNQYEFGDSERDTYLLKKMPQFFHLTEEEIKKIMASIDFLEMEEARRLTKEKLTTERMADSRYLEEHPKDPVLPSDPVCLQLGIRLTKQSIVDDNGFITSDDLTRCKRGWKLSLGKKHIYLGLGS